MSVWETIGTTEASSGDDIELRSPPTNPAYDMEPFQHPSRDAGFEDQPNLSWEEAKAAAYPDKGKKSDSGWETIGDKGWETISKNETPKTSFSPDDIPGAIPQNKPREFSTWEKVVGVEEAALATATGMITSAYGMATGVLVGLITGDRAKRGGMGEQVAEHITEQSFQPKTPAGQEYTENTGDVFRESGVMGMLFGGPHIPSMPEGASTFLKEKILPSKAKVELDKVLKDKPVREDTPIDSHVASWEEQVRAEEEQSKQEAITEVPKEEQVVTPKEESLPEETPPTPDEQLRQIEKDKKDEEDYQDFVNKQTEEKIKELPSKLSPDERLQEVKRIHDSLATWKDVGRAHDPELAKITDAHELVDHITNKLGEDHFISTVLTALKKNLPKTKVETISKEAYLERYIGEPPNPRGEDWTGNYKWKDKQSSIYLKQGKGENLETATHEIIHAALSDKIQRAKDLPEGHPNKVRYTNYIKTLESISEDLKKDTNASNPGSSVSYALSDLQELPTMGLTSPAVLYALSRLPSRKASTYIGKIVKTFGDFLGFHPKQRTALHDLFEATVNISKIKRTPEENAGGGFSYQSPSIKPIPHASSVGDAADFNTKGKQVLRDHGKEAAKRFAEAVTTWKRNQDMGIPKDMDGLSDILYRLGKNKEADKVGTTQRLEDAQREGVTLDMKIRWREFAEGTRKELLPEEMDLFNKYYAPEAQERVDILKSLQEKGWVLPLEMDTALTGSNVARMTLPPEPGPVKNLSLKIGKHQVNIPVNNKFLGNILRSAHTTGKDLVGGDMGGFDTNVMAPKGGAKERGLFVAEFPSRQRIVVQMKGKDLVRWEQVEDPAGTTRYKMRQFLKDVGPVKAGDKLYNFLIKEATEPELEKHSPYRYNKDSQAVLYQRVNELREFYRGKQMMENLKKSEFFLGKPDKGILGIAHKTQPNVEIPEGYRRPNHLDRLPELDGYAFEKNVSYIIEDFSRVYTPNILTNVSSILIKNMMLNPIPHMMNEGWHLYNARGLTGWFTPVGLHRFGTTMWPSIKEVAQMGPQFRSLLRDGASLLSSDVRNNYICQQFLEKGAKEFIDSPDGKHWVAKLGTTSVKLYNTLSHTSSKYMWMVRDAMYMQMIKEKMMKGMTQKQAIAEVERHMPAYKVPTTIMGNRAVSKVLQNPNVTIFSRYHYGMMKSLVETANDLRGKNGIEGVKHGVDTTLAIVVALAVLYPLQDMLAKAITGNDDAEVRRAGPYHPAMALAEIAKGEKDPQAFMASIFTFNPALLYSVQLAANRKLYNGQPVFNPTDDPNLIAKEIAKYTYTQVPQISTSLQVMDEKKGGGSGQWLAKQLDIKSPTKAEVKAKEAVKKKLEVASRNRARKALRDGK